MSLFTYGIELWGGTYSKYINQIDKFINSAYRNGYILEKVDFREFFTDRDRKLWKRIINNEHNSLQELLPNKINPRADGAKRRARVLIPPGYLHPGKRKH